MELSEVDEAARDQGWRIERRGDRLRVYVPPDKSLKSVYFIESASMDDAIWSLLSELRRAGFRWPWPPEGRYEGTASRVRSGLSSFRQVGVATKHLVWTMKLRVPRRKTYR
jgi:hypothetical protein